jgi:regulator of chromosome condensation
MAPPSKKRKEDNDNDDDDASYFPLAKKGRGTSSSTNAATTSSNNANKSPPPEFLIRGASNMSIGSSDGCDDVATAGGGNQGRLVRKSQYIKGAIRLNYQSYECAKTMLQATTTTTVDDDNLCAVQRPVIDNYFYQSSELHRRFNRNYGDVIVFGSNFSGQLGLGDSVAYSRSPRILMNLRGTSINMVACGGTHSLALTNDGIVYSWGNNDTGCLGWKTTQELDDGALPSQVTGFYPSKYGPNRSSPSSASSPTKNNNVVITQIASGDTGSLALSSTGDVYMWGTYNDDENRKFRHMPPKDDKRTPTGYTDMNNLKEDDDPTWYYPPRGNQDWPMHVVDIPMRAKDISAGDGVNAALLEDDTLVTWGVGKSGELARPVPEFNKQLPMEVIRAEFLMPKPPMFDGPMLLDRKVLSMSCGVCHLLVVTKEMSELNVYSSGLNNYGQLGHGDRINRSILTKVKDLVGCGITKVAGGQQFSCFLDITGRELYAAGRGDYGQLGITLEQPAAGYGEFRPCRVPLVYEPKEGTVSDATKNCINEQDIIEEDQPIIEQISCGGSHTLALTNEGDVYSWGFGEEGACGHGKSDKDVFRPKKLESKLVKSQGTSVYKVQYVSCGGQHSAIIAKTGSTGFVSK